MRCTSEYDRALRKYGRFRQKLPVKTDFRKNSARRRPVTGRSPRTGEEAQYICSYNVEQLREIGYLDYTEIQRGRTKFFCIHYRRPRLKAPNDESKENPLPPSPAEKVSPEMAEKLALLEKLGITLDDLEKLFKSR